MESYDECLNDLLTQQDVKCSNGLSYKSLSSLTFNRVNDMFIYADNTIYNNDDNDDKNNEEGIVDNDILFYGVANGFELSYYNSTNGLITEIYHDNSYITDSYETVSMAYDNKNKIYWKYDSDSTIYTDLIRAYNINSNHNFTTILTIQDGCLPGSLFVDIKTSQLYFTRLCYTNFVRVYKYDIEKALSQSTTETETEEETTIKNINATFVCEIAFNPVISSEFMYNIKENELYLTLFGGNTRTKAITEYDMLKLNRGENETFISFLTSGGLNFQNTHVTIDSNDGSFWFSDEINAFFNIDEDGEEMIEIHMI